MALHELFIDGKSTADFGAYVCGGGTWDTPKRKGSVIDIDGRNGTLWIDGGAWGTVPVKYVIIFNNNNKTQIDAFTTWLASLSMGEHRIEDTLHERYYRIGRVDPHVSPSVFEKWNSSKFVVDIICRPEKYLKSADEYQIIAPMQNAYMEIRGTTYHFYKEIPTTEYPVEPVICSPLMYYEPKLGHPWVDIYVDGIAEDDDIDFFVAISCMNVGDAQPGETCRFGPEYGYYKSPTRRDGNKAYIRWEFLSTDQKDFMSYRFFIRTTTSTNLTVRIEQGGEMVTMKQSGIGGDWSRCSILKQVDTPFSSWPLIRVRGWSFCISLDNVTMVAEDFRDTRPTEFPAGSDSYKMASPADFYIDCQNKEVYYVQDGDLFDYTEHVSFYAGMEPPTGSETPPLTYRFPNLVSGEVLYANLQPYNNVADFLFCSVAIKPRWYQI